MAEHRLFLALRPPEAICEALLDPMEALDGARWQEFDNLHVTLRFIGEVSRHQADDLALTVSQIRFAPFPVTLAGVGHFEKKRQPHAIWARVVPSPQLSALQAACEQACQRAGLVAETRKFIPHLTLARLSRASGDIAPWLARHETLALGPWQADALSLYESHLGEGGAHYQELERFPAQP